MKYRIDSRVTLTPQIRRKGKFFELVSAMKWNESVLVDSRKDANLLYREINLQLEAKAIRRTQRDGTVRVWKVRR